MLELKLKVNLQILKNVKQKPQINFVRESF